jgi:hypothetical protein
MGDHVEANKKSIKTLSKVVTMLVENSMIEQSLISNFMQSQDMIDALYNKFKTRI